MALHNMALQSTVWDDVAGTVTLTFVDTGAPPPPPGGAGWWPGPGATVTTTVPIKKATTTNPTGIQVTTDANGVVVYTKYEFQNGTWVSLGRVNADGTPYTG
jgi:hypothetical protein